MNEETGMQGGLIRPGGRLPEIRIAYAIYWTVCAVFAGMLLAPLVLPEAPPMDDHAGHYMHDHSMAHGLLDSESATPPRVELKVVKDASAGWNVEVLTENFEFTPKAVNRPAREGTGHGHIFVNGEKQARLYGPHFHLSELPPGRHVVVVTLNANNHDTWAVNGAEVSAQVEILQP
ncbi:MAG: hypothetical protein AAGI10_01970 [Pseudomonadota bacterium]